MRSARALASALLLLAASFASAQEPASKRVTGVRFWTLGDTTRVVIETTAEFSFRSDRVHNPDRVYFDVQGISSGKRGQQTVPVNDKLLKQIRLAETERGVTRVVFDLQHPAAVDWSASQLTNPDRLIVELRPSQKPLPVAAAASTPVAPAEPPPAILPAAGKAVGTTVPAAPEENVTAKAAPPAPRSGEAKPAPPAPKAAARTTVAMPRQTPKPAQIGGESQSMTRVLGLKIGRIVLDAGHGGHDAGSVGPDGLMEKDLTLDICKRLGALIESRMQAEVVYTRPDDTFIPLERRTEIANTAGADLFLSVHANSSHSETASGVETYYLNFTSDRSAMGVAARENAGSQKTVHELKDLLQKIALQDKVDESRQFAASVQSALYRAVVRSNTRTKNRGVKKAPFIVLIGAAMPSILAEVGFISNPQDEQLLRSNDVRQRIAEGLYRGLAQYAGTLSQFQVASN